MLAAYVSSDMIKNKKSTNLSERKAKISKSSQDRMEEAMANREKKFSLLRRYMQLLKSTMVAFFLSTCIHVGCISAYFYIYLYLNPEDPGKKQFYAATQTSPGINIGGKMVGGGGISTNAHKSYVFHLIREHYKALNYKFFFQFSAIYLMLLIWLKFFSERAQLKLDTAEIFNLNQGYDNQQQQIDEIPNRRELGTLIRRSSVLSVRKQLKRKSLVKKKILKSSIWVEEDVVDQDEKDEDVPIEQDEKKDN